MLLIGCLLALGVGGLASLAMPLVPFILAVMLVAVVSGLAAIVLLPVTISGLAVAVTLLAASQIGYGLGLVLAAITSRSSMPAAKRPIRAPRVILRHPAPPDN